MFSCLKILDEAKQKEIYVLRKSKSKINLLCDIKETMAQEKIGLLWPLGKDGFKVS